MGDIVTFSYDYKQYSRSLANPKIHRYRMDTSWEDIAANYKQAGNFRYNKMQRVLIFL